MPIQTVRMPHTGEVEKIANSLLSGVSAPDLAKIAKNQRELARSILALNKAVGEIGKALEKTLNDLNRPQTRK